jgi:hypothetical protein
MSVFSSMMRTVRCRLVPREQVDRATLAEDRVGHLREDHRAGLSSKPCQDRALELSVRAVHEAVEIDTLPPRLKFEAHAEHRRDASDDLDRQSIIEAPLQVADPSTPPPVVGGPTPTPTPVIVSATAGINVPVVGASPSASPSPAP